MEWNGEMENGMEWWMYTIIANLCKLALFFKDEQAMMHLGILSHRSSCMMSMYEQVQCCQHFFFLVS